MKMLKLSALLVSALAIGLIVSNVSFARITASTGERDIWCVGVSGAEICVDSSGNLIPTTDDDADLGTSSLQFKDAYIDGTLYTDVISNEGAYTGTTGTFSGQVMLQSVSSTTIKTLVPGAVGALVYNNTRAVVCTGTATVAGAWVYQSTNPITNVGISCKE